jgi:hypothetical protein
VVVPDPRPIGRVDLLRAEHALAAFGGVTRSVERDEAGDGGHLRPNPVGCAATTLAAKRRTDIAFVTGTVRADRF